MTCRIVNGRCAAHRLDARCAHTCRAVHVCTATAPSRTAACRDATAAIEAGLEELAGAEAIETRRT